MFFRTAPEVSDASPLYVGQHLDEVGGTILPGSFWATSSPKLFHEFKR